MIAAVNQSSNGFGGGLLARTAGDPTNVSGNTLSAPGAAGFPAPQVGTVKEARNNRGSNEKVPYARLVPMRPSDQIGPLPPLPPSHGVKLKPGYTENTVKSEFEDLKSGELAWVRGNMIRSYQNTSGTGDVYTSEVRSDVRPGDVYQFGIGPDRFQRLASTSWVERYFYHTFGDDKILLSGLSVADDDFVDLKHMLYSSELGEFGRPKPDGRNLLQGSVVTNTKDVVYALRQGNGTPPSDPGLRNISDLRCGINTTTTSPFLHGFRMSDALVRSAEDKKTQGAVTLHTATDSPPNQFTELPRNYADKLAFTALYSHMRRRGFMSWTPDGLTLSKLASPADDAMASEELDMRSGQLYNVAVAGNSIATTWTGDPEMPSMPGDAVYVLIVADIITEADASEVEGGDRKYEGGDKIDEKKEDEEEHLKKVKAFVDEVRSNKVVAGTTSQAALNAEAAFNATSDEDFAAIANLSQQIRTGEKPAGKVTMANFRLRRATSSYLAKHSEIAVGSAHCRCGLKMGKAGSKVTAQYFIGGWKIGVVLDNAASRAGAPAMGVRTAPSSYAISVNVAVEWVSGDLLFRKYDGGSQRLRGRGEPKPPAERIFRQYTEDDDVDPPPAAAPGDAPAAAGGR